MWEVLRLAGSPGDLFGWFAGLVALVAGLFEEHDRLVLFLLIAVEEAGVPLPVPTDSLIALAGHRASTGRIALIEAILAVNLATLVGATVLYAIMRRFGDAALLRFGRYLRLEPERIVQFELWTRRNAVAAVYFGRLVPGLRIVTSAAAGMLGVPLLPFLVGTVLASITWCSVWLWIGWVFGDLVLTWLEQLRPFAFLLLSLLALAIGWWWTARRRAERAARRQALEPR